MQTIAPLIESLDAVALEVRVGSPLTKAAHQALQHQNLQAPTVSGNETWRVMLPHQVKLLLRNIADIVDVL